MIASPDVSSSRSAPAPKIGAAPKLGKEQKKVVTSQNDLTPGIGASRHRDRSQEFIPLFSEEEEAEDAYTQGEPRSQYD